MEFNQEVNYVDSLEELFQTRFAERAPQTPEYEELRRLHSSLMDELEKGAGEEPVERLVTVQDEYLELECRRFFLHGVRFGLELLRL